MQNFNIGPLQNMIGMIENTPAFNNPNAREMIECIKNNDSQKGQQIVENLCKSYGISPQDALKQARSFFHI